MDIFPELRSKGGFKLRKELPGTLVLDDGPGDPSHGRRAGAWLVRQGTKHRITVEFAARGTGTCVTLTGSVESGVRDALHDLGEPGKWPEISQRLD